MTLEPRAFLFAHPARHSLSPAMHDAALRAMGIQARYEARDVPPDQLKAALNALRGSNTWGVNLSIPHKERAFEIVDDVSDEARAIGAINTVIVRGDRLEGRNTDAPGFIEGLRESGVVVPVAAVTVLGAGGAARGIVWGLKRAGAAWVKVWNRSFDRAARLAEEFGVNAVSDDELEAAVLESDLVVNATSVGLDDPDASPLPPGWLPSGSWFPDGPVVCDIVYRPLETRLLREAREAGLTTVGGLGMLVHQGALALEAWTGHDVPVDVMRRAALGALEH